MTRFFKGLTDAYDTARNVVSSTRPTPPSPSGAQVRQSKIQNERPGYYTRNLVRWLLPETGIVEMYINPQGIKYTHNKHVNHVRTRGGYLIQYWGEELGKVSINGTTGSSGVEGINVLEEVYRNEQVSMDPIALAAQAAREQEAVSQGGLLGEVGDLLGVGSDNLFNQVENVINHGNVNPVVPKPTLASIAFQTEMYWSGWVFRGYFTQMTIDESADRLGLFNYGLEFTVTQKRGWRLNFLPWHRSAVNGPSDSDPINGTPHSFQPPAPSDTTRTVSGSVVRAVQGVDRALQSHRPLI